MKATVQINYKAWEPPTLYVFYIDFDLIPRKNDKLEIEYNGKIIQASVYDVVQRLKMNLEDHTNTYPEIFIRAVQRQECDVEHRNLLN